MVVPAVDAPARPRVLPLLWRGPLLEPTGYADAGRAYLLALERAGYAAAARDAPWLEEDAGLPRAQREAVERARRRPAPPGEVVVVHHVVPHASQPLHGNGPDVARTTFETDRIPRAFLPRLMEVDEVWVPCEFNLDTFRRGGLPRSKLRVLPETLDFDLYDPATPPLELPGRRRFAFLSTFDFTDRKGWDLLLDAWADAFSPDDDVCLVLKCLALHDREGGVRERIEAHLRGRPTAPILVLDELLRVEELPALYAAADAYVMASRGEGWGRPYMEAMAMGLPTIGSRWSGNLAFMHDRNSWLVDGRLVEVPDGAQAHAGSLYRGHRWFEPDREALAAAMREVAAGGPEVARRAAGARAELLERFGPGPVAARIVELTEEALERWRWRRSRPVACVWRGDWGSIHSLAVVNEAVADAAEAQGAPVERLLADAEPSASVAPGVAQQWPPRFEPPSAGPFVLYQPWEYGAVPAAWVEQARRTVDEVWAPSEAARQAWIASGLAPELVHVVPNGVDLAVFTPEGPRRPLPTDAGTVLLFVGGALWRKGIDLLLEAYGEAFAADDDVCLVVKCFGSADVYRGHTPAALLEAHRARPDAPELVVLDDDLAYAELPALYRAADVVVQPYRAEGFCLPALEALACGVPVIVTAGGPTDDVVSERCGWRIPSRRAPVAPDALPGELRPGGEAFTLEPDRDALVAALREAARPEERARRAAHARVHAERFGWERAAEAARERLAALAGREPVRRVDPHVVDDARGLRLVALDDWQAALRAFAEAFAPTDPVTLVLPGVAADDACAVVDPDELADVALVEDGADPLPLVLGADAVVGAHPRARRAVPAEPAALRALLSGS
ncbi:MAG: glycosyltransferase [Thermoleophilia bacterium]|nr:glycosyltransferase [Thermoleophilia bacterium]